MTNRLTIYVFGALALAAGAQPAGAADRKNAPPPAVLEAVIRCRALTDTGERLRCYDAAAEGLSAAVASRKLYALDRSQVEATRRSLFGLPLPNLGFLGGAEGDEAMKQLDATLTSASLANDGDWTFVLDTNAVWRQTDEEPLGHTPKRGDKITIKTGALGSHKLTIGKETVRVTRVR